MPGWTVKKASKPFVEKLHQFMKTPSLSSPILFAALQAVANESKKAIVLNIALPGCKWPLLIYPQHRTLNVVHIFVEPLENRIQMEKIFKAVKPGKFKQHSSTQPQGEYLGRSTTGASWAASKGISKNFQSTTYEFHWNLYKTLITHMERSENKRKPIKSLPFNPIINLNVQLLQAPSIEKSLLGVFNYVLLTEGQIKSQQALSLKKFNKYVRRNLRDDDYYSRVVRAETEAALKNAVLYWKEMRKGKIIELHLPKSHCCNTILRSTEVFSLHKCLVCRRWFASTFRKRSAQRNNTIDVGFKDILRVYSRNGNILPKDEYFEKDGQSWILWLINEEGGRARVEERLEKYMDLS